MHILVVEDERALCDTIARSLRRLAYSVDCCYDGQSAAEMLAIERFDLVVLDLNLPGEDGMTVLRTLRERADRISTLVSRSRSRSVLSTVMPSSPGRFRSSTTRSKRSMASISAALCPS